MFNCKKLFDFNFSFAYTKLFHFKILVVFGYIALWFNMLIYFLTNIPSTWAGQLLSSLFIYIIGAFFLILLLLIYVLLFVFIIVDLTLFFSKKNIEEKPKKMTKSSMLFSVLNSFIFLYALWYLGFNIVIFLFLVSLICLIKYLICGNIHKKGLIIRLGFILLFLLMMSKGIAEGIIFDKGQWSKKYLFNNEIIQKVHLLKNTGKVLVITKQKGEPYDIVNQKLYICDLNKNRVQYNIAYVNENVLKNDFVYLNKDENLIINKKYTKGESIITFTNYNLSTKELDNIKSIVRKNINEEFILLKNGNILILPIPCRNCENYEVYNPYKNEFYYTKNSIGGYINVTNIKRFNNGNLLIPSENRYYIYDLEKNTFDKGSDIKINEKCALYNDEYIFDFNNGYKYSISENKKIKIKKLKKLNVKRAISLENGNFLVMGSVERPKILVKYDPTAGNFQNTETSKIYLYITKYDYYVQLKSFNVMGKEFINSDFLKLENGNILFWNRKNSYMTVYEYKMLNR